MFGFGGTRTLATLAVTAAAFDEIASKLRKAGYDHAFVDGMIDMEGIGLARGDDELLAAEQEFLDSSKHPAHRPIAPNAKQQKREPKR